MGHRGIVSDPNIETKSLFKLHRPNDIFVNAAVGLLDKTQVDFYFPQGPNKISLINTKYPKKAHENISPVKVNQVNINSELKRQNIANIDILNIDVEGAEQEIIETFDYDKFNTSIVCVEIHGNNILNILKSPVA